MPILMYHHIDNVTPASALDASLTTNDAEFSKQLAYLRCAGYTSVTLQQLFDGIYTGAPLPSKPVVLTFDDGYSDAFTDAFPLLRKYGFGGSFAIVTGFVGQPGYVNWDQVKQMAGSQMEMMSHTVNHADLNRYRSWCTLPGSRSFEARRSGSNRLWRWCGKPATAARSS